MAGFFCRESNILCQGQTPAGLRDCLATPKVWSLLPFFLSDSRNFASRLATVSSHEAIPSAAMRSAWVNEKALRLQVDMNP